MVLLPDSVNGVFAQPLSLGHTSRAPVGGVGRRRVRGGVDHGLDRAGRNPGNTPRARRILFEPRQPKRQKALPPELHRRSRDVQGTCNIFAQQPLGSFANNLGALNQSKRDASCLFLGGTRGWLRRFSLLDSIRTWQLVKLFMRHYTSLTIHISYTSIFPSDAGRTAFTKSTLRPVRWSLGIQCRDELLGCWGQADRSGQNNFPGRN